MSGFIEWLEGLNRKDTKVRAVLRRSLSFEPGTNPASFPYVEPFVKGESTTWRRNAHYLVAGLWAQHWREGMTTTGQSIGQACASYKVTSQSSSTEARFVALLDADEDQLPYRMRQMIALLKDQSIDFEHLLKGLLYWHDANKYTQINWAKDFYRNLNDDNQINEEHTK
jgi:CRISPR system Cascade subunit CasB